MLESLHVKNLALIKEAEIEFSNGLNILTGETGAGKSIIIGSINMALGGKANKDLIRSGEEYALVEMIFTIETEELQERLAELEIPMEEDNTVLIQRKLSAARSVCKIGGETVSQKQVKEVADLLIDIHGQHDNSFLLNRNKHLEILDGFCGKELDSCKEKVAKLYSEYRKKLNEWNENSLDDTQQKREISLLEYELKEISEAQLVDGEDEELENSYRRMSHARKLLETVQKVMFYLDSENDEGAGGQINRAVREMNTISGIDQQADELSMNLQQLDSMMSDFLRDAHRYEADLDYEEDAFRPVEDRLNLINRLKEKYGHSIEKINQYGEEVNQKLQKLQDYDVYRASLKKEIDEKKDTLNQLCGQLTEIRKKYAKSLCEQLKRSLQGLNFLEVSVELKFEKKENYSADGADDVEFMISLNPGEPVRPLCEIASGGELSRIMLGLKTILAGTDQGRTFIFDEIDAGISGKTAWKVAEKLGQLSQEHQIITITHLPQIAAMGRTHFEIEKRAEQNETRTIIHKLNEEESIEELARLLGGDVITESARNNAKEMREIAKTKTY